MATAKPLVLGVSGLREIASGDTLPIAALPVGTTAGTVAAGDSQPLTAAQFDATFTVMDFDANDSDVQYPGNGLYFNNFSVLKVNTGTINPNGAYNTSTGYYTVPVTGTYEVEAKVRCYPANGVSFGLGVDASTSDAPHFMWFLSNNVREGALYVRTYRWTAGTAICLFGYGGMYAYRIELVFKLVRAG